MVVIRRGSVRCGEANMAPEFANAHSGLGSCLFPELSVGHREQIPEVSDPMSETGILETVFDKNVQKVG